MAKPSNDRDQPVTKFCRAMEDHRRTEAGRVRTAKELVAQFFPYDEHQSDDRLFLHMPPDVRGPVLARWGIRGAKAALKDDDAKVKLVVHDALVAGDIDDSSFEDGITSEILIDWIALAEWWSFWRNGRLTGVVIQKALATARDLGLIDDKWFLENIEGRGGKLRGTDVLCDTLSKEQLITWIRKLHEGGDGSPAGLVGALGWQTILDKSAQDALLFALDQLARKVGLAPEVAEARPTIVPGTVVALPAAEPSAQASEDIPVIDDGDGDDESPKLAEARAALEAKLGKAPTSDPPISLEDSELQRASSPHLAVSRPPPVPSLPRKPGEASR